MNRTMNERIVTICELIKALVEGDAGVTLYARKAGYKAVAVIGIPFAKETFLIGQGKTVDAALDHLEERLKKQADHILYRVTTALARNEKLMAEMEEHPLVEVKPT